MNFTSKLISTFILGFALFVLSSFRSEITAFFFKSQNASIIVPILLIILYSLNEYWKFVEIKSSTRKKIITALLARVNELKYLDKDQNLRSNIFTKSGKGFQLTFYHNMENDPDNDIVIPINMGVTGDVFRQKLPVFAKRDEFYTTYKLPPEIFAKIRKDLEWIVVIPILNDSNQVIMTLCVDGNKDCCQKRDEIIAVCKNIATDIKDVLDKI